jgi:predicted RNA-binding protein with PIN domain
MAFLIDGSNLLGHRAPGGHRDRAERGRLVAALLAFQRLTRSRVVVVFDGPPDGELEDLKPGGKFHVLFPPPGEKADGVVEELLAGSGRGGRITLVTSDRELRAAGRSRGAELMTSPEFDRRLRSVLRRAREARELSKPDESPTPLETRLWLDLFKERKR